MDSGGHLPFKSCYLLQPYSWLAFNLMPNVYGPGKMKILFMKNEHSPYQKNAYVYWVSQDPVLTLSGKVNGSNYARVI